MNINLELSEKQKTIVFSDDKALYVKASAGSGKTRVLTERVRYLLGKTNKKILALTFTTKAGDEIKDRLRDIADVQDRTFIGTFHSFCQSVLENHGRHIGLEIMPHIFEVEADRLELIEQAIEQTPTYYHQYIGLDEKGQRSFRYRALSFISEMKRKLIADSDIVDHTQDDNIVLLYQGYQDILSSQNAIDFDDLLLLAYSLFSSFPKIAGMYKRSFYAICVDEAQDLNNAQYEFLKVLAGNDYQNIMMVGDPNQSIYHFNGSSPDYMDKEFVRDFKAKTVHLTENYRSSIAVLNAARQIVPNSDDISNTVKDGVFELTGLGTETGEAQWVVDKIKELVELQSHQDIEGDITCEKIAILARNRYVLKHVEDQLKREGISYAYKITPGAIQFETKIMKVFDLAFRVRLNPKDILHKKRLWQALDISEDLAVGLEKIQSISEPIYKSIVSVVLSVKDDGSNLKHVFEVFLEGVEIDDYDEKLMLFNEVAEFLSHWHNYATKTDKKSLHQFKNSTALGKTQSLSQHKGVTLSTVHAMKGQEYDIVFLVGLDDGTFPDYRAVRNGGVELKQEQNNLYVAFTRARRFLYATWPQVRKMPWGDTKGRQVSRFLRNIRYSIQ